MCWTHHLAVHAIIVVLWLSPAVGDLPTRNTELDRLILPFIRRFRELHTDLSYNKRFVEKLRREQRAQMFVSPSMAFPCQGTFRSEQRPSSVHALMPGDIDIVAAMGDSLTAGNGAIADSVYTTATFENRGVSWSGGATADWRSFVTLPNILREFNPNLIGFSLPGSFNHQRSSQFNVAEAGAVSQDMPLQARNLVKRLKSDRRVDIANDWKLITILVGSNDFCIDMCYGDWKHLPQRHIRDMRETLAIIKRELPRTLINFVLQPDLQSLLRVKKKPLGCQYLQLVLCPCLVGQQFQRIRPQLIRIMNEYRKVQMLIANDPMYADREDFAVILQPFTLGIDVPDREDDPTATDMTYFAPDCFHLSQKGYATAAMALWNNMMEPVGNKSVSWTPLWDRFMCPTRERPYISTPLNSL